MKVLIVASRFPYPIQRGDKLRLYHQIKILAKHVDIYLYCCSTAEVKETDKLEIAKYCKETKIYHLDSKEVFGNLFSAFLNGVPFQVGLFSNPKIKKEIKEFSELHEVDHIYCQLIRMAENVRELAPDKTIDYMDAFGYGMKQRATMGGLMTRILYNIESRRVKKYETKIFEDFDNHTIITEQDKSRLNVPNDKLTTVANGVDFEFFSNDGGVEEYDLVFVGNMGYLPNIDAAKILAKKILPTVNELSDKTFKLLVAGARPTSEIIDLAQEPNVTIAGWVQDIRGAYKSGRIFVAPIFKGIGQQNKILEAMSMEIPCVVNTSVAVGLGIEHKVHCIVADTVPEFAQAVLDLDSQPELLASIIVSAKHFVTEKFDWKNQTKALVDLIKKNAD